LIDDDDFFIETSIRRNDGRKRDEIRPITIVPGKVRQVRGSAYIEWGNNKIIATVTGPQRIHDYRSRNNSRAIVVCKMKMAPFAFEMDALKNGGSSSISESKENIAIIANTMSDTFSDVILTEKYPRTSIDIAIEVLQAGAGLMSASITASSVALIDAGIPVKDLVSACTLGTKDGKILIDIGPEELKSVDSLVNLGLMPRTCEYVFMDGAGKINQDIILDILDWGTRACESVARIQRRSFIDGGPINETMEFNNGTDADLSETMMIQRTLSDKEELLKDIDDLMEE